MSSKNAFVTGDAIWDHIQTALSTKQPVCIAVPFIGQGVSKWLKLPTGSCLVTRCDLTSARAGQVSGSDLLNWHKKGVRIFNLQSLHAKVFAFEDSAFIGSSNASATSRDRLIEAGVWTTEKSLVKSARDFVEGLALEPVEETFLERLAEAYRPANLYPLHGESTADAGVKPRKTAASRSLDEVPMHLVRLDEAEFDEAEQSAAEQAEAVGAKRLNEDVNAEVSTFTWPDDASIFEVGDLVLLRISNRRERTDIVEPWARVVAIRKVRDREQYIVATATIKTWKEQTVDKFRQAMDGKLGSFLGSRGKYRVASPEERDAILKVWRHRSSHMMR